MRTTKGGCTFNFLFAGSDGHTYAGTAAHCLYKDNESGRRTFVPGEGPVAHDADGARIGEFAFTTFGYVRGPDGYPGDTDFALIRLDADVPFDPSMCHWGGPTGLYEDREADPTVVRHYGGGVVLGDTIPARTGVVPDTQAPDTVDWYGAVLFGDSGSGMISADGRALAVNVRLGAGVYGNNTSTRVDFQIAIAEAHTGLTFDLLTAPLEAR